MNCTLFTVEAIADLWMAVQDADPTNAMIGSDNSWTRSPWRVSTGEAIEPAFTCLHWNLLTLFKSKVSIKCFGDCQFKSIYNWTLKVLEHQWTGDIVNHGGLLVCKLHQMKRRCYAISRNRDCLKENNFQPKNSKLFIVRNSKCKLHQNLKKERKGILWNIKQKLSRNKMSGLLCSCFAAALLY